VLLIAASILAARKLAQFDGGKRVPATMSAIADAVRWAEEIMRAIDGRLTRERPKVTLPENVRKMLQRRFGLGRFGSEAVRP